MRNVFILVSILLAGGLSAQSVRDERGRPSNAGTELSAFRRLIGKLPEAARRKFLSTMVFSNGRVVTVYTDDVKKFLSAQEQHELRVELAGTAYVYKEGYAWRTSRCVYYGNAWCLEAANLGSDATSLEAALARMPRADANAFLDTLDFSKGRLAAPHMQTMRRYLTPAERGAVD